MRRERERQIEIAVHKEEGESFKEKDKRVLHFKGVILCIYYVLRKRKGRMTVREGERDLNKREREREFQKRERIVEDRERDNCRTEIEIDRERERIVEDRYEESVVDKFKSNLLLMIFWLHIINYNS